MADLQITGTDCLDLCDEVNGIKHLASALFLAIQAVEVDHRKALSELASIVEDRLSDLSKRMTQAAGAADPN